MCVFPDQKTRKLLVQEEKGKSRPKLETLLPYTWENPVGVSRREAKNIKLTTKLGVRKATCTSTRWCTTMSRNQSSS